MQASIRTTDRCVVQVGTSLGDRADCTIVELTAKMQTDLSAVFSQPHGNIYLAADGTVTADPYIAPVPPPVGPDQTTVDNAIALLRATFGTARTAAQANQCIDALTVILRRIYVDLR